MTVHIPLASCSHSTNAGQRECEAGPSTIRSFGTPSLDPMNDLKWVIDSLRLAKRIVVVSGAGVSTAANIPDFRSESGLFTSTSGQQFNQDVDEQTITRHRFLTKKRKLDHDIKDLFHVRCLSSPTLLAEHQALISSLATISLSANPTAFHSFLRTLDDSGRLLRCYTQNIDGLEGKAGLTLGIPPKATRKGKGKNQEPLALDDAGQEAYPSVIPLHGLLNQLHCQQCQISLPLPPFLPLPSAAIPCPTCELTSTIRSALSERTRKTGMLRASVVLYGEEHPQGDLIGSNVEKDLTKKAGADFLLVTGTSLSVPGVKRVVKEMSKRVKMSSTSRGKKKNNKEEESVKTVFVNNEPPAKVGEWKEVFDVWIQGDIQEFIADYLDNPLDDSVNSNINATKEEFDVYPLSPTPSTPRKRRLSISTPATPQSLEKKRKISETKLSTPRKKKSTNGRPSKEFPPTPESLPRPQQSKRSKSDICKYRNDRRSISPSPSLERENDMFSRESSGSLTPLSSD